MSVLEIPAKEAAPYVRFDEENGTLQIKGKSYDEDVVMLYSMLRNKLKAFGGKSPDKLDVNIYLKYFNTSSSKCLFDLLSDLKDLEDNGTKLSIVWNFVEGDDEMGEDIEDFRDSLDMEFEVVPLEDDMA
ncbi:DUF1987 domain-containing protein [Marivirga arenosa]|jgi:hypothetical protein|uniref:DUF1987 domain-containing protein n=1 Tax=Marivirga arenosa TaxID=3059076 RepID=A0AA51N6A5_9BACT|nr:MULTISPECIES: DUF1987 domain-containing protein [unclassified Marivirga]WKK81108.2 DUF1987 domain-containing protein [Marivirga sp. BKB1-2]WMN06984.1 DUF1987 domain-containing protein [Marivirga sp. ABR2-2]